MWGSLRAGSCAGRRHHQDGDGADHASLADDGPGGGASPARCGHRSRRRGRHSAGRDGWRRQDTAAARGTAPGQPGRPGRGAGRGHPVHGRDTVRRGGQPAATGWPGRQAALGTAPPGRRSPDPAHLAGPAGGRRGRRPPAGTRVGGAAALPGAARRGVPAGRGPGGCAGPGRRGRAVEGRAGRPADRAPAARGGHGRPAGSRHSARPCRTVPGSTSSG